MLYNTYSFGPFQPGQQKQVDSICKSATQFWNTITETLGSDSPGLPALRENLDTMVNRCVGGITTTAMATHGAGSHSG